ncbi:MAG: hypothetical protein MJA27_05310 [Pseudanabaenales cyanobacterium]|nr:hypothetical protein [Pseudanabaenales cyanobacterium]
MGTVRPKRGYLFLNTVLGNNDEAKKTTGEFRLIDGVTLLGMLQIPLHLQPAIAQESQIYTLAAPPQPIGRGSM